MKIKLQTLKLIEKSGNSAVTTLKSTIWYQIMNIFYKKFFVYVFCLLSFILFVNKRSNMNWNQISQSRLHWFQQEVNWFRKQPKSNYIKYKFLLIIIHKSQFPQLYMNNTSFLFIISIIFFMHGENLLQ